MRVHSGSAVMKASLHLHLHLYVHLHLYLYLNSYLYLYLYLYLYEAASHLHGRRENSVTVVGPHHIRDLLRVAL